MLEIFKKIFGSKEKRASIEATIGEKAIVVEKIHNIAGSGLVKVNGQLWAARSVDADCIYERDDTVTVVAIEGVKLICK